MQTECRKLAFCRGAACFGKISLQIYTKSEKKHYICNEKFINNLTKTEMMRLNNGFKIPQIGVGTWTLRGETARQNVCLALQAISALNQNLRSNALNDPETFPW